MRELTDKELRAVSGGATSIQVPTPSGELREVVRIGRDLTAAQTHARGPVNFFIS